MYKKSKVLFIILFVLSTLFIFSQSAQTADASRSESGMILKLILSILPDGLVHITMHMLRKFAHYFEFFMQSVFICAYFAVSGNFFKNIIYTLFFGLLTGSIDEYIQLFFEGRGSMVSDVFIDFSGTVSAVMIFSVVLFVIYLKNKKITE